MSIAIEAEYTEVEKIDQAGRYRISGNPDVRNYRGEYMGPSFVTSSPFTLPALLIDHLYATFPDIRRLIFKPAYFHDGSLSAPELDYKDHRIDRGKWSGDEGLLDFDGHLCQFRSEAELRSKRNDKDRFNFDLEDKGRVSLVHNRLEVLPSLLRNSRLNLYTEGYDDLNYGNMTASIDLTGDNRGELIREGLKFISEWSKSCEFPIWKISRGN